MGGERYKHLTDIKQEYLILGCPVVIEKGALLHDTITDTVILRLRVRNVSQKMIKYLSISVIMYDDAYDPLIGGKPQEFVYLDLSVNRRKSFGDNQANILSEKNTRRVKIIFDKVVFTDEDVWRNEAQEIGEIFPEQKLIQMFDADLLAQFNREFQNSGLVEVSDELIKYLPQQLKENWQCSCGFTNAKDEIICFYCGMEKEWIFKNTEVDLLNQKLKEYTKEQAELEEQQRLGNERVEREKVIKDGVQKEREKTRKNKTKKYAMIIIPIVIITAVIIIVINMIIIPEMNNSGDYTKAIALVNQEKYLEAKLIFKTIEDYKESKDYLKQINEKYPKSRVSENYKSNFIITGAQTIALRSDGTVFAVGLNKYGQCNVDGWNDIIAISASESTTVGLRWDGTVVSTDRNTGFNNWSDIKAISTGGQHTVGLKEDGTVVAVGSNSSGECNVQNWTDIVAISTGVDNTIGLKKDGTVVATENIIIKNSNVTDWTDIIAISQSSIFAVGLKSNGTVVATGFNGKGQCDVSSWTDITAISADGDHTVGLKSNGTVVTTDNSNLNWTDITAISSGVGATTVGLKKDGTVVSVGMNVLGQGNVGKWKDIIAIGTGKYNTIGLKSDGTVIVAGENNYGQCDIWMVNNISVPLK